MMLDHAAVERAESEIDNFILKRNREREDANEIQALWAASEARERARRHEENREAWVRYERHMEALHASLSEEHRERAEALSQDGEGE
jgi:hypothetical protein